MYAARIRGCCVQEHWVGGFLFVEVDRDFFKERKFFLVVFSNFY